jgi:hypothetical protein
LIVDPFISPGGSASRSLSPARFHFFSLLRTDTFRALKRGVNSGQNQNDKDYNDCQYQKRASVKSGFLSRSDVAAARIGFESGCLPVFFFNFVRSVFHNFEFENRFKVVLL